MKFAFNTSVFRNRGLAEAMDIIAKAGFANIEVMADHPHALPEEMTAAVLSDLQETLKAKGLTVSALDSMTSRFMGTTLTPSWIEEDWEARERRIRYTLDCVRMAAAMGIPYVITQGGGTVPESMNRQEAWRLFVANMFRVLPLTRRLGVKLLIAPHPGVLIETSTHLHDLLKELKVEYDCVGVYFDAGAFHCSGEDPCDAWEVLKADVGMIRLSDMPESGNYVPKPLGEGAMNLKAFLDCARLSTYEGTVSVVHDSKDQSAEETIDTSVAFLRDLGLLENETP